MRRLVLAAALLLPAFVLAQTAQTNCYNAAPTAPRASQSLNCTTTLTPGIQSYPQPATRVNPSAFSDGFQRAQQMAAQIRAQQQQEQLAAAQRESLELQNQQLRNQLAAPQPPQASRGLLAEAAVIRFSIYEFAREQSDLPREKRISQDDSVAVGKRVAEIAAGWLGYEPSTEAMNLAAKQINGS